MKRMILFLVAAVITPVYSDETPNKISSGYELDLFMRTSNYGPWHLGYLEYSRKFDFMTLVGRFNYANRSFGGPARNGVQVEMDAWPRVTDWMYGYLNLGYSPSAIFPRLRAGVEPYFKLPWSFETSLGLRYLAFKSDSTDSISNVFILSGHLGKYLGNYWFSVRPFLTFKPLGASISGIILARRYFKDAENYAGLMLGYGSSPEELVTADQVARASSYKAGLELAKTILPSFSIKPAIKYEYEEYRLNQFGHHLTFSLTAAVRF